VTASDDPPTGALHHVELYASDFEASVAFWDWFLGDLGYEEKNDWDGGRSWVRDPTTPYVVLVAAEDEYASEGYHRKEPGLNHLAFHARSREHVDETTEKLRERGRPVLYEDDHPHAGGPDTYALYFEDPERIKVELVAPE
jgi:catechol 2,3-dioxygenase-like lactoylglutathione lyase family enzyme